VVLGIEGHQSSDAPLDIREVSRVIGEISLIFLLDKLFLDLTKQVFLTGRVDADFEGFNVGRHGAVLEPRFDPVHVNLVHDGAVQLRQEEAVPHHGLILAWL